MATSFLKYREHYDAVLNIDHQDLLLKENYFYEFKKARGSVSCYSIFKKGNEYHLNTSYCIGIDWIEDTDHAIYVEPKVNKKKCTEAVEEVEIDYLNMLFASLPYLETADKLNDLFEIKWNKPEITIEQSKDLLTPLLVIQYLALLKTIVRKGLKKSYYRVENNLNGRIKGRVLIGQSIKKNQMKNKQLYTYCQYDEFGLDGIENRLLKMALVFVKRYLPKFKSMNTGAVASDLFNYISPAFESVSDKVDLHDIKHLKNNSFYKEYAEATRLAKIILSRFGYNISNIEKHTISIPPFWIDMSKLFEYYVFGLLKSKFPKRGEVKFQFISRGHELDYLLNSGDYKMIIDAKYKPKYSKRNLLDKEDFRQLSGYARLKKVYKELQQDYSQNIDCLIIYPDLSVSENNLDNLTSKNNEMSKYVNFYKLGVKIPLIVPKQ